jgi:hypothetical protein
VALSLLSTPAWSQVSDLRLELESDARTLRVGQDATLKMRIAGAGVGRLVEGSEGVVPDVSNGAAFVYEFKVKPRREGPFVFGPYQISFNGQALTSNTVSIQVLPPWNGVYGTFFRVDSNSITLGQSVELVMETWSEKLDPNSYGLRGSEETFLTGPGSYLSSMTVNGSISACWRQSRWLITPKKAGEFRITKDLFRNFPANVTPPDIAITVRESPQPAIGGGR